MSHSRHIAAVVIASILAVVSPRVVRGEMRVESLKLVEPAEGDTKKKAVAVYRAVVAHNRPGLKEADFTLKDLDVEPNISAEASKVVGFKDSDDKLSLVILIQGDERWMGNETYQTEEDEMSEGAFTALGAAVDALSKGGPAGSMGALMVYATGKVEVRQSMGPIEGLGAALGTQQDYQGIGVPLTVGLDEAYSTLAKASGRRVLVVFGDGTGKEEDISGPLAERIRLLKDIKAQVYTVFYAGKSDDPAGERNMRNLGYSGAEKATERNNFGTFAEKFVGQIGAVYYVTFPALPFATAEKKERELTVVVDEDEGDPVALPTIPLPSTGGGGSLWWLWLLIILLVVIIVIVILVKKKGDQPQPMPVEEAPLEEAPAPAGPQKTMMIGIGNNDEGMPIVGWVVPLTGPNQYQTFKLLGGATTLGTGGAAHVVVDDQFMSTEHAEIVCAPDGLFVLNDGGSTNGTFVNEKRISTHELVDNDVFKLGQTDFKFKSIN